MDISRKDYIDQIFEEAGWYQGRKTDIHDMKYALIEDGFTVFPAAEAFLEEFGGLELVMKDSYYAEKYIIDPKRYYRESYAQEEKDCVTYYENKIANEKLCIVAYTKVEDLLSFQIVFLSESGRFYFYVEYLKEIIETKENNFKRFLHYH